MGEPANPTPKERAERHKTAEAIVESVIADEEMPLPGLIPVSIPNRGVFFKASDVEDFIFHLAHEITILRKERGEAP